jgi:hypothetical protein
MKMQVALCWSGGEGSNDDENGSGRIRRFWVLLLVNQRGCESSYPRSTNISKTVNDKERN